MPLNKLSNIRLLGSFFVYNKNVEGYVVPMPETSSAVTDYLWGYPTKIWSSAVTDVVGVQV